MHYISKLRKLTYAKLCARVHLWCLKLFGVWIYPSYWRYLVKGRIDCPDLSNIYMTACPNPGAGIGHQIANWIAGYWWAEQFCVKFAHLPFSNLSWDYFLGFGENEAQVSALKKAGWKVRRIPLFKESDSNSLKLIKDIISSYSGKKIIILCEQDQFYRDQYGVIDEIQAKFFCAPARKENHLLYDPNNFNIAIHVRRGDIMTDATNENLMIRILGNDYYEKVLLQTVEHYQRSQGKPIHIYFFSQGRPEDFKEFECYENLHWCMDMGVKESFLHMVYADLLITSKSSFSYKPALLNRGIKVCPENFWHGYPDKKDWIMCDDEGNVKWKPQYTC